MEETTGQVETTKHKQQTAADRAVEKRSAQESEAARDAERKAREKDRSTGLAALGQAYRRRKLLQLHPQGITTDTKNRVLENTKAIMCSSPDALRLGPAALKAGVQIVENDWIPNGYVILQLGPGKVEIAEIQG